MTDLCKELATERLKLVPLCAALHYGAVRRINGDADAMRYITGKAETPWETRTWLERVEERWRTQGYSWWAILHQGDMVGAAALQHLEANIDKPFEIGWRLARRAHKQGFATEAARALLAHAQDIGIDTVLAVADPLNEASRAVMHRIGMTYIGIETHYDRPVATYRWQASHVARSPNTAPEPSR